jgi:hypothetical protein
MHSQSSLLLLKWSKKVKCGLYTKVVRIDMSKLLFFLFISAFLSQCTSLYSMVVDNRYLPLITRMRVSSDDLPSFFAVDLFACTANNAFGKNSLEIPMGELFGEFDQGVLARAFVAAGMPNPFAQERPEWQEGSFIWHLDGKLQSHGFMAAYRQEICNYWSVGVSWMFMRLYAHHIFTFKSSSVPLDENDKVQLDEIRRSMNLQIGLPCNAITQAGFGDVDMYLRLGNVWHYPFIFKTIGFRRIEAGVRVGALIPSGVLQDLVSPASVPFGGNGHWGCYGAGDLELELKEDFKIGVFGWLGKRFTRTCIRRVPADKEQPLYGVLRIPVRINPGITVMISPYVQFENLREGFGMRLRYTLTHHEGDTWDKVGAQEEVPKDLKQMCKLSRWSSDYLSVTAFYDFGKMKLNNEFSPLVSLSWDIPLSFVWGEGFSKTHRVSLGIEYKF